MNLIEAIGSGKEFRRKSQGHWTNPNREFYQLSKVEILAGDYEVKDRVIEIQETALDAAVSSEIPAGQQRDTVLKKIKDSAK